MVRQSTDNMHDGDTTRDPSSRPSARWIGRSIGTALLALVAACGGGSSQPPSTPPPPAAATLATIAPGSAVAGSGAFTLTVNGSGFVAGSVVSLASMTLTTTFVSATQVTAAVPANAVTTSGSLTVLVTNPGSSASNALNFSVTAPVVVPLAITSISPATLGTGSAAFTLNVVGTGFTLTSKVVFNGGFLATTFVDSTHLTAAAPALTGAAASIQVVVVEGTASTTALVFAVTADAFPAVLSLSPGSRVVVGDRASSNPKVDGQGRFVAFQSAATNLVPGDLSDGSYSSIYVRDTCVGASAACAPATRLVSINVAGTQCVAPAASLGSVNPVISADGRFIAFGTDACFTAPAIDARQIALRDTCVTAAGPVAACTPSTTLISANGSGQPSTGVGRGSIPNAALSRNARYVAWSSTAVDLVAGVVNGGFLQLYLRDRCRTSAGAVAGCVARTLLVSGTATSAANWNASQGFVAVSDNGIVVFGTSASNLVANGGLQPGIGGAVLRADCSGGGALCNLTIVSIVPGTGDSVSGRLLDSGGPSISADGRYIGFIAQGENSTGALVSPAPPNLPNPLLALPGRQAMRLDTCASAGAAVPGCAPTFSYQSVLDNGNLDIAVGPQVNDASLSDDGRFMAFVASFNLSPLYPGAGASVYVRDSCGGPAAPAACVPRIALVSIDETRVPAGNVGTAHLSGDGHFVVFYSVSIGQIVMVRTGF